MLKVGLTGGMGSGKSTVANRLSELGATVIDADQIAREIVEPGQPALAELVDAFGAAILNEDGSLNRAELARRAFRSDAETQLLNSITHPRIAERTAYYYELVAAEEAKNSVRNGDASLPELVVVYDMPLLLENGLDKDQDVVAVVHTPVSARLDRLVAHRGVNRADAERRIKAQISDEERLARADVVFDNSGTREELLAQVDNWWPAVSSAKR